MHQIEHRSLKISSNWVKITIEIERINTMLVNNNYPQKLVDEEVNKIVAKNFDNNNDDIKKNSSVIKIYYENQMNKNYKKRRTYIKKPHLTPY